jgi:serine/threonine-protein kinase
MTFTTLRATALSRPEAVSAFLRGARVALQNHCDHLARVTDVGRLPSGMPYVVSEHLDGTNLGKVLRVRGSLPVVEAIDYIVQALRGVAGAHAHGALHGALSPSGLVLVRRADGSPLIKVLDLGLPRSVDEFPFREGSIANELRCMAPEQIRESEHIDGRTDVWALGAILYELVAGRPAFRASSPAGLLAAIAADRPPAPSTVHPDVPVDLDAITATCLEKDPAARYPTVGDLALALRPLAAPETQELVDRVVRVLARATTAPSSSSIVRVSSVPPPAPARSQAPAPAPRPSLGVGLLPLAVVSLGVGAGATAAGVVLTFALQHAGALDLPAVVAAPTQATHPAEAAPSAGATTAPSAVAVPEVPVQPASPVVARTPDKPDELAAPQAEESDEVATAAQKALEAAWARHVASRRVVSTAEQPDSSPSATDAKPVQPASAPPATGADLFSNPE